MKVLSNMISRHVKTAIFPVAGFGTRMLPATKTLPKEMLTVVDKPLIQYVYEEAVEAGIEKFIFVTGRNKAMLEDHFDHVPELEEALAAKQKTELLDAIQNIPKAGSAIFVRQQKPLGLGHAVWCARHMIDGPFAVLLPDVILRDSGFLKQMVQAYEQKPQNILGLYEVDPQAVSNYGVVGFDGSASGEMKITQMVEKPAVADAPSNMSVMGRYILSPKVMDLLENAETGAGGEVQLTDAMQKLLKTEAFSGMVYRDKMYDCGSREGYIEANLDLAYEQDSLREVIDQWIANKQSDAKATKAVA